jgi:hypothetical protein
MDDRALPARVPWIVGILGYSAALAVRPLSEFDLPWHLAWGRAIAEAHAVPRTDPLAYTHTPVRYIGVLADLALYGAARLAGEDTLQVLGGLVGAGLAAALLFAAGHARRGALLAVPVALAGASGWVCARPAALTFVLTACVLGCIGVHRADCGEGRGRVALFVAAGLHAVWCNVHGGALLGVALMGLYAAHCELARRLRRPRCERKGWLSSLAPAKDAADAGVVWLAAAAALGCTLLNPWGVGYFRGPLDVAKVAPLVIDWQRTSPRFFWTTAPLAGGALALLVVTIAVPSRRMAVATTALDTTASAWTTFDLAIVAAALLLATRIRFVPLSLVLLAPIAAKRLEPLGEVRSARLVGYALALAAGLVVFLNDGAEIGAGWRRDAFPEAAVAFVREARPQGNMYNFWPYGGFLGWRLGPEYPVFLDGRIGFVHATRTVLEANAAEHDPGIFRLLASEFSMEWAVCRSHPAGPSCRPLAADPAWAMVYVDDVAAVYVRRAGPNAALASRGFRLLRHTTEPGDLLAATLSRTAPVADLAFDAGLALKQAPGSTRTWFLAGCAALALGDRPHLEEAAEHLAILAPGSGLGLALSEAAQLRAH